MAGRVLDTSVLISFWRHHLPRSLRGVTVAKAASFANELIADYESDAILTPIYLEFIAGVRTAHELKLAKAFLGRLRIVDDRRLLPQDWVDAQRRAQRVPRDGEPRALGDCLIAALADRFNYEVVSLDVSFPR